MDAMSVIHGAFDKLISAMCPLFAIEELELLQFTNKV